MQLFCVGSYEHRANCEKACGALGCLFFPRTEYGRGGKCTCVCPCHKIWDSDPELDRVIQKLMSERLVGLDLDC